MQFLLIFKSVTLILLFYYEVNALCSSKNVCCLNRDDSCRFEGCFCDEYCLQAKDCCSDYQKCCGFFNGKDLIIILIRRAVTLILIFYYITGTHSDRQKSRQKWFRVAMAVSDWNSTRNCLKNVLCEAGCSDMIKFGKRDDNPQDVCGDPKNLKDLVDAYGNGQRFGEIGPNTNCTSKCAGTSCDSNWLKWLLSHAHEAGMTSFDAHQKVMEFYGKKERTIERNQR